ncbi:MAG: FHA domain-containing protein [Deltaproteobacteria bacterium]|nr:FHA domain-containing protein [Deltaproteobacteria bacterium]
MDVGLVCDSCSAFSPMGAQRCLRCGESLSLDKLTTKGPPSARAAVATASDSTGRTPVPVRPPATAQGAAQGGLECPTCGAMVPVGHRFCFSCGSRMPDAPAPVESFEDRTSVRHPIAPAPAPRPHKPNRSTMFFGAIQAAHAKLTVIRGDGMDGVSYTLAGEEHVAGRGDVALPFADDPYLSPQHANFFYRDGKLVVRDLDSLNGVFVRIHGSLAIPYGTRFLVGEQILEVQRGSDAPADTDLPSPDGTYFFASPRRASNLRLVQTLRGGDTALALRAASDTITIGREGNDLDFPEDPFISGHHARVSWEGGAVLLADLSSRNGTFVRIVGEHVLDHGDYVFMGQELLRVEIV